MENQICRRNVFCYVSPSPSPKFSCESPEIPNPLLDKISWNILGAFYMLNIFHSSAHWDLRGRQDNFRSGRCSQNTWSSRWGMEICKDWKGGGVWGEFPSCRNSISKVIRLGGGEWITPKRVWGIVNYSIWSVRNRREPGLGNASKREATLR